MASCDYAKEVNGNGYAEAIENGKQALSDAWQVVREIQNQQPRKVLLPPTMTRAEIKRALAAAERQEKYRLMVEFAGKGKGGPSKKFGFCWCIACKRKIHPGKHRKHARHCDMVRAYQDLHGIVRKGQGID